ncbi:MAG: hypothetical protein IIZ82_05430 [Clostridia bacterium]|nr:hypothetical protein [Clostridia bacterium]
MGKTNEAGVYQLENGLWAYRFIIKVDGKQITSRKTTDEYGNKLRTKKQAVKAREAAIIAAHLEQERKRKISRRTVEEVYNEYREKGRADRAYRTIQKQESLWKNHLQERFGKRYVDEISVAEINDYLAELYFNVGFSFRYTESFLKMFYLIFGQAYSRDYMDVDSYNKMCLNKDTNGHFAHHGCYPLSLGRNVGFGFIQDCLDLLAVRLALSFEFRKGRKEPLLDDEEGLRLTVCAILVDGPLADESEVLFLVIGAMLFNIGANGLHVQVREVIFASLGLDLDNLVVGIIAACGLQVLVGVGAINHGVLHFGAVEFDGVVVEVNSHGIYLSGVGRHPLFFFLFGREVFVFLISYVCIIAGRFVLSVTLLAHC